MCDGLKLKKSSFSVEPNYCTRFSDFHYSTDIDGTQSLCRATAQHSDCVPRSHMLCVAIYVSKHHPRGQAREICSVALWKRASPVGRSELPTLCRLCRFLKRKRREEGNGKRSLENRSRILEMVSASTLRCKQCTPLIALPQDVPLTARRQPLTNLK